MFIFLLQMLGIIFLSIIFIIMIVIMCLLIVYKAFDKHYDELNEVFKDECKKNKLSK